MALTTAQQADILFKKLQGQSDTSTTKQFFEETKPGRQAVYANQLWAQSSSIPTTAPGGTDGQTTGVVTRYIANSLTAVPGLSNSFYSANLIDCIPFNFGDGSYNYVLTDSTGTSIAFGAGDWVVDCDAGVLTFFGTVPSNMPPKLSWYKYAGTKGVAGALSVTAVGSAPNANAASVTGSALTLQPADGTNPGVFTAAATAQTIGGVKTWSGNQIFSADAKFSAFLELLQTTDSTTTGSNATLALPTPYVKVTNASLVSISTITLGTGLTNQMAVITNGTATVVSIVNGASLITGTGANLPLAAGASIIVIYDSGSTAFRVVGGSGGGGGGGRAVATFTAAAVPMNATGDDVFVYTGSSAQTFTGFGTLAGSTNGKRVSIMGTDDTNVLSLAESDTTNGWLMNGPLDLVKGARIEFEYSTTLARMVETGRSPR